MLVAAILVLTAATAIPRICQTESKGVAVAELEKIGVAPLAIRKRY